jgi:pilus assembly protein CpaF
VLRDLYGYRQLGIKNGETVGEFYATGYEPTFLGRLKSQGIDLPASLFKDRVLHTENE